MRKLFLTGGFMMWLLLPAALSAQPSNAEALMQELRQLVDSVGPVKNIHAFFPLPGLEFLPTDTTSTVELSLSSPSVVYGKAEEKSITRQLRMPVLIQADTTAERMTLHYQDTISYQTMRTLNRNSQDLLKGEDPTFRGKWLIPLLVIGAGTGINFALFYLRSR